MITAADVRRAAGDPDADVHARRAWSASCSAPLARRRRALLGRAGRGRRGRLALRGRGRRRADRGRYEPLDAGARRPRRPRAGRPGAARARPAEPRRRVHGRPRRRRGGVRGRPTWSSRRRSAASATPRCRWRRAGSSPSSTARTGVLTVWGAAKIVHVNRRILARLLGWPEERVRLVELDVGGGFGARGEFYPEDFLIPWCAIRPRPAGVRGPRTARSTCARRTTRASRCTTSRSRSRADGTLPRAARPRRARTPARTCARTATVVPGDDGRPAAGPYRWRRLPLPTSGTSSPTRRRPGTYRAPGRYEATLARERMIDIAARRLGLDPLELRRRNLVARRTRCRYDTGAAHRRAPGRLRQRRLPAAPRQGARALRPRRAAALARRARRAGPAARPRRRVLRREERHRALGVRARRARRATGAVVVHAGRPRSGRASRRCSRRSAPSTSASATTTWRVRHGDTDDVPDGMGSFGSRATALGGQRRGARRRRRCASASSSWRRTALEAATEDLEIAGDARRRPRRAGRARSSLRGARGERRAPASALPPRRGAGPDRGVLLPREDMSFPYGLHCAAVEVDIRDGRRARSSATRSPTTSAARSTRCWSRARSSAAPRRASAARCSRSSPTTREGSSSRARSWTTCCRRPPRRRRSRCWSPRTRRRRSARSA